MLLLWTIFVDIISIQFYVVSCAPKIMRNFFRNVMRARKCCGIKCSSQVAAGDLFLVFSM